MADVFVSYKREDEAGVARLVKALRGQALSVWWDRDIPTGAPWEDTIEREHAAARSIVVCWSKAAVASENVKAEARAARADHRLVQTFIEPCNPPMFFGERQGVDLSGWSGKADDPRFQAVLAAVRAALDGKAAEAGVGAIAAGTSRKPFILAGVAAAVLVAGGIGAMALRPEPAKVMPKAAPAPSPADVLLAKVDGKWGVQNKCDESYRYRVARDAATGDKHIFAERPGFKSEGRVVSAADGVILSEALEPAADRGNLVELRPEPGQLVLQDRRTDTRLVLVKCR